MKLDEIIQKTIYSPQEHNKIMINDQIMKLKKQQEQYRDLIENCQDKIDTLKERLRKM